MGSGRRGIKTAGSKLEHGYNLFPRHVEPLHDFLDTCAGLEVLENGGNRHAGVLKNPCATESPRHAFDGGALGPIEKGHSSHRPFIAAYCFLPHFGAVVTPGITAECFRAFSAKGQQALGQDDR